MPIRDYLNGPKYKARATQLDEELTRLQAKHAALQEQARQCGALDLLAVRELVEQANAQLTSVNTEIAAAKHRQEELNAQIKGLRSEVLVLEEAVLLESFALYTPKFSFTTSQHYKAALDKIRDRQKALIKTGQAATGSTTWTVNGKAAEGRKMYIAILAAYGIAWCRGWVNLLAAA